MAKPIPQSSIENLIADLESKVARKHIYADIPAMILLAAQQTQKAGELIRVTDATADANVDVGAAYYDYTGAETQSLGDYFLVSAPESSTLLEDGIGTTANGNAVDLGGGSNVAGQRFITIDAGGVANQLRFQTDTGETDKKWLQIQQDLIAFYGNDGAGFGAISVETQGDNYPAGNKAGFFMKDVSGPNELGAGMYAGADGYIVIFPGAARTKMKGITFAADYPDIDWATDLAANGLLIPHQKRVQAMIDATPGIGSLLHLNTWYVNPAASGGDGSPQDPYTINEAMAAAASGDVIVFQAGLYTSDITVTKNLTFIGYSPEGCLIDIASLIIDTTAAGVELILINLGVTTANGITETGGNLSSVIFRNVNGSFDTNIVIDRIQFFNGSVIGVSGNITTTSYTEARESEVFCTTWTFDGTSKFYNTKVVGDISAATRTLTFNECTIIGNVVCANLNYNNTVITGTKAGTSSTTVNDQFDEAPEDGNQYARKDAGWEQVAAAETIQSLTVTDANYTTALVLAADTNIVEITLDAALTNDWQPATITGWVVGRTYTWMIVKESDNGVDLTTARAVPNVGYPDDINPFADLIDIDTTQQRAVLQAVGFKSSFGQFGRLIITDSGYAE